ncbi:MAG TPA: stage III sporulation protein AF [Candidatus Pseudogracilibacillus intestinigallinarum]|uniref:Stage III sporulation protein AF n=1 Tax=Candidatus Pseudogracilibacillus intestinigallinarum TaxID=2838742 RepID=A0A9D1PMA0_9BACI|nr:stage III sporulation protein AF [Candidatus Pseudogracilibacillus intestinigallinarum]
MTMQYIVDWVTQIIIFIFIGTIIQILLPENQFRKYVEIVLGLFLLLIFLQPVVSLMNISLDLSWHKMEQMLIPENVEENITWNGLETERDAYIWNESKEILMEEANRQLTGQVIRDIDFILEETTLQEMVVYLDEEKEKFIHVDKIIVNDDASYSAQTEKDEQLVKKLQQIWEVNDVPIKIQWGRRLE